MYQVLLNISDGFSNFIFMITYEVFTQVGKGSQEKLRILFKDTQRTQAVCAGVCALGHFTDLAMRTCPFHPAWHILCEENHLSYSLTQPLLSSLAGLREAEPNHQPLLPPPPAILVSAWEEVHSC